MAESIVESLEGELHELAKAWADPHEGECLLCYVYRMLGRFDCAGLRWSKHYRDVRAPRATGLEKRLMAVGGGCDCELFMNGYQLLPQYWAPDESGDFGAPDDGPPCTAVRRGSTQHCQRWMRRPRGLFAGW